VVLQRHWRAEDSHDAVAGETADCAAKVLQDRCSRSTSSAMISRSRTDRGGDVHRMNNIGEQHRHLLVLGQLAQDVTPCPLSRRQPRMMPSTGSMCSISNSF